MTDEPRTLDEQLHQNWQRLNDIAERIERCRDNLRRQPRYDPDVCLREILFDLNRWRDEAKADYEAF